ncbi:pseudaminic acid cytidylyltransferase [Halomonas profundus]|nr:pseudaminic acid cytidylyltransferase [Halomonas profundus]
MNRVAIIPARGGSKRIPRKNVKPFFGKPMIAWSIQAARESGMFDRIIVSTDDEEIAQVGKAYGAEIPFLRPAELSDDHTGLTPVMRHAIEWLQGQGDSPSIVACAYATAPFLRAVDLAASVSLFEKNPDTDYVLAVTRFPSPVQRAFIAEHQGYLKFLFPEFSTMRSQDLHEAYHDAGHFLMGRADAFIQYPTSMAGNTLPHWIPRLLCQDIDTPEDWAHAEELFAFMQARNEPVDH